MELFKTIATVVILITILMAFIFMPPSCNHPVKPESRPQISTVPYIDTYDDLDAGVRCYGRGDGRTLSCVKVR